MRAIRHAIQAGVVPGEPGDQVRGVVRWQQADLSAQHRGRNDDHKAVTIGAEVEHIGMIGQFFCKRPDIRQETPGCNGLAVLPGKNAVRAVEAQQRDCLHGLNRRHQRTLTDFEADEPFEKIFRPSNGELRWSRYRNTRYVYSQRNISTISGELRMLTNVDQTSSEAKKNSTIEPAI